MPLPWLITSSAPILLQTSPLSMHSAVQELVVCHLSRLRRRGIVNGIGLWEPHPTKQVLQSLRPICVSCRYETGPQSFKCDMKGTRN